ncbi:hypothetical protein BDW59DRAFT_160985 [Aspergillus cavernicola]|uniref:Uncharacterized protein n=1 Tax=Aspergillus cavernicola TaxID=176166 RepID=A0ABR4II01_9EURO
MAAPPPIAAAWLNVVKPTTANNFLNLLNYNQVMDLMEAIPQFSVRIFDWGLSVGPWQEHQQFSTQLEIIAWHHSLVNVVPPLPSPAAAVNGNMAARNWPIERLIRRNQWRCLTRLHRANHWDPLSFSPRGVSYLHMAHDAGAKYTFNYIVHQARGNALFCTTNTSFENVTGIQADNVHFDFVLELDKYKIFRQWWRSIITTPPEVPLDPILVLTEESQRILCRKAARPFAEYLRTHNNFHLATTSTTDIRGTVWHLAVENPNSNFVDFLATNGTQSIDMYSGHFQSPLDYSVTMDHFNVFKRLLSAGANPDPLVEHFIQDFEPATNKWLRASSAHYTRINSTTGQTANGGTIIHKIIEELHSRVTALNNADLFLTPAQKARKRRNLIKTANGLIRLMRVGSRHGRPDMTARNLDQRTALDLALFCHFPALADVLQTNPGRPVDARGGGDGGGAAAWGHRYPTRRAPRARGT